MWCLQTQSGASRTHSCHFLPPPSPPSLPSSVCPAESPSGHRAGHGRLPVGAGPRTGLLLRPSVISNAGTKQAVCTQVCECRYVCVCVCVCVYVCVSLFRDYHGDLAVRADPLDGLHGRQKGNQDFETYCMSLFFSHSMVI